MSWAALISAAIGAYSAYDASREQKKAAKEAAKGTTTTRTPYYGDAISQIAPYLLQEAQRVYEGRQGAYGFKPGDFSPFAAALQSIPQGYTGVSGPSGAPQVNPRYAGPGTAFSPEARESGPQNALGTPYTPVRATIPDEGGQMPPQQGIDPQMTAEAVEVARAQNPEMVRYWEQIAGVSA